MDDDDAIAIVGVGCKVPGADNLDEFWKILINGENKVLEIPKERWNNEAFYSEGQGIPGKTYARRAGLITNHCEWDNTCFDITDSEAEYIDPQQRYVLECVHMALEDGGITRKSINGSDTGVFIGVMNDDYKGNSNQDLKSLTNYTVTGSSTSIISARVSYVFNLLGTSMCIDTACSSSSVAIDTGIMYLKSGRCSMVICGGVSSILTPETFVMLSQARMLSPTGQCMAFSEKADGYARGEGCGIVILKKLSQATKDHNKIWATIAACCNHDGGTVRPMTAPSMQQQEELLKMTYSLNNVNIKSVQAIEAHGTGTPKGDPIEANSLGNVFTGNTSTNNTSKPVYIGSVKTNIGHLESAAGVVGLIKVLLMMKNQIIVRSLHFDKPNINIDFEKFNFSVPTKNLHWIREGKESRLACVNSFGFGGTNAHIIVKEYIKGSQELKARESNQYPCLIFLTSKSSDGLLLAVDKFLSQLENTSIPLSSISYTSIFLRDHFQFRAAFCAKDLPELKYKCSQKQKPLSMRKVQPNIKPKVVAVFCGVGTYWRGMCSEMMRYEPKFVEKILEIDKLLQQLSNEFSIYDVLVNKKELTSPAQIHTAIFSCQVALWSVWQHWGLKVNFVLGQSVGEVTAAYASGSLSLEMSVNLIYLRSKYLAEVSEGKMFVLRNCSLDKVLEILNEFKGKACIAVHSSPVSFTISCDTDSVSQLKKSIERACSSNPVLVQDLNVNTAYHSHHTETAGLKLENGLMALNEFRGESPTIPFLSTVTGHWIEGSDLSNPSYWRSNVRKPVLLEQAVKKIIKESITNVFLEIGPRPVLKSHFTDISDDNRHICLSSMEKHNEIETMMNTSAQLFETGVDLNWKLIHRGPVEMCNIPNYAFVKKNKLFNSVITKLKKQGLQFTRLSHPFIQSTLGEKNEFYLDIRPENAPFVYSHFVSDTIVVPGAVYAEVALEVASKVTECLIEELTFSVEFVKTISLQPNQSVTAYISLTENNGQNKVNGIIRRDSDTVAKFSFNEATIEQRDCIDLKTIREHCTDRVTSQEIYSTLSSAGFTYGPELRLIKEAYKNDDQGVVTFDITSQIWNGAKMTHLHPAIIDALIQSVFVLNPGPEEAKPSIPTAIGNLMVNRRPEKNMFGIVQKTFSSKWEVVYNVMLVSTQGQVIAEIKDLKIEGLDNNVENPLLCELRWQEIEINGTQNLTKPTDETLVFCLDNTIFEFLRSKLPNGSNIYKIGKDSKDDIRLALSATSEVKQLFYIAGTRFSDSMVMNPNELYDKVLGACVGLYAILQCVMDINKDFQITVITENTQVFNRYNQTNVNLFGSELWGLIRSIVWEHNFDIHLLDVHQSIEASEEFIMKLLTNEYQSKIAELLYSSGRLYTNNLHPYEENGHHYRTATLDNGCEIRLKTHVHFDLSKLFCTVKSSEQNINNQCLKDWGYFNQTEICRIVRNHKPGVLYGIGRPVIWPDLEDTGFDITCMESIGQLQESNHSENDNQKYVLCFPVLADSKVFVPRVCTYPLNNLIGYRAGIVSVSAVLFSIASKIEAGKCVNIVYQNENTFLSILLRLLLEQNTVHFTTLSDIHHEAQIIVPLDKICYATIKNIVNKPLIEAVVTLDSFIDPTLKVELGNHHIRVKLIQVQNVFVKANLMKIMPTVFRFLSSNLQKIDTCDDFGQENQLLTLPEKTIQLEFKNVMHQLKVVAPTGKPFRKDCSYIVIGGLSGLGWELLKVLAAEGAGEVIVLSRRKMDKEKKVSLDNLTLETGCQFKSFSVDITDFNGLQMVFNDILKAGRYVKGIFQGAGILKDTFFHKITTEDVDIVLKPKVLGTWNLHVLSSVFPLDYFVVHSSITSIFGNYGQSNYGAGNSFMDCLMHYRQHMGLCGQSINWGLLSVGMPVHIDKLNSISEQWFHPLSVNEIKRMFLKCLDSRKRQMIVGNFDWSVICKMFLSSDVDFDLRSQKIRSFVLKYTDLRDTNQSSAPKPIAVPEEMPAIVSRMIGEACNVPVECLTEETHIHAIGFDSLVAMHFTRRISEITRSTVISVVYLQSQDITIGDITRKIQKSMESKDSDEQLGFSGMGQLNGMTPMEKLKYDLFRNNPNDPSLIIVADLDVPSSLADPEIWRMVLKTAYEKHSILRTMLLPNQKDILYGVKKHILRNDEIILPFKIVQMKAIETTDIVQLVTSNKESYIFNPAEDLPFRLFYSNENKKCIVRFVFNNIFIDLSSIGNLVKDFMSTSYQNYPDQSEPYVDINVYSLVEKRLFKETTRLETFWKTYTPKRVESMTFRNMVNDVDPLDPLSFHISRLRVDETSVKKLKDFLSAHRFSIFHVITSLYQLLFHAVLQNEVITILADMDMRLHFTELVDVVGRMTNPVIMYNQIKDREMDIITFIDNNRKTLVEVMKHSLLPFQTTKGYINDIDPKEVFAHSVIMEDMSVWKSMKENPLLEFNVKNIIASEYNHETRLIAWFNLNENQLNFELVCNNAAINERDAQYLLNTLGNFIEETMKDPVPKVKDLSTLFSGITKQKTQPN